MTVIFFHDRLFHTDCHVFFEFPDILAVLCSISVIICIKVLLPITVLFTVPLLFTSTQFAYNMFIILHYSPFPNDLLVFFKSHIISVLYSMIVISFTNVHFPLIVMFSLNYQIYLQFFVQYN